MIGIQIFAAHNVVSMNPFCRIQCEKCFTRNEKCFTRNGGKPGMQEWEGVGGWGVGFILGEVGKFLKSLYIVGR